jgi:hypothetical protein
MRRSTNPWSFAILSGLTLFLAALTFYSWTTYKGLPPRDALLGASGQVTWVQKYRYGVRFRLSGNDRAFVYYSKGGAMNKVAAALGRTDAPQISVLYDPNSAGGPAGSAVKYFSVFEIAANGTMVRSRAEVERAWQADQSLGLSASALFLFLGLALGYVAFRRSRWG